MGIMFCDYKNVCCGPKTNDAELFMLLFLQVFFLPRNQACDDEKFRIIECCI
jgi:hypothetical protein